MHPLLAAIVLFPYIIYCIVESLLLALLPVQFRKKKNIQGQTILITGAGSGIGRAMAIEFSKYATCLLLLDINKKSLLETEEMLNKKSSVFLYECDVSDRKMVYEVARQAKKEAGKVDILVNNAGIIFGKNFMNLPDEKIQKTMEVNSLAHFWMCKAFLPEMIEHNSGHIVSIASIAGFTGGTKLTDYCSSKFAVVGFAESLQYELAQLSLEGIKVTLVCPSAFSSGFFEGATMPFSKIYTPEYVAKKIIEGVLTEELVLFIPRYFSLLFILKAILPCKALIAFYRHAGSLDFMKNFKGRPTHNYNVDPPKE